MHTINEFLEGFYKIISFEQGESFKSETFRELFHPTALLFEKVDGGYKTKTIGEHIQEFEDVIKDYPQLFVKGFHEVQIDYEIIESEACYLISSTYKKTYWKNGQEVIEYGKNNMTIIGDGDKFKITCIIW